MFFVLHRQETMLRCCGGSSNGGERSGSERWRRRRWRRGRRNRDPTVVATDGLWQKYKRVSGRTFSSVDVPTDDDGPTDDSAVTGERQSTVGLADCWLRALKGRLGGSIIDGGSTHREMSTASTGDNDDDNDDDGGGVNGDNVGGDPAAPPTRSQNGSDNRHAARVASMTLSSNWTMISNSSLRDVNGEDLRDELFGYVDAMGATGSGGGDAGEHVVTVDGYY